ncbi:hypothetical protein SAMN02745163_00820 [Clostridium cavendishii DSM 21758]|uniref:Membrane-associated protein n=1 Tax=Clostridium cavendishii DSM 21758 TaxID=1121302 RepID=A0A1M6ECK6_9CLOT|nr:hypothetical protein [Clostridium cavendishii]SHI83216.1 hypothetical protein SAMN02745163_00820 [Clostridium cavendishii DSM 21758]
MNLSLNDIKNQMKEKNIKLCKFFKELIKKTYFKYIIIGFFVLALIIGFLLGSGKTSREAMILKIDKAIEKNDYKEMSKIIKFENKNEKVTEENIIPLVKYYKENNIAKESLINALKQDGNNIINLKKQKKFLGEDYYLTVKLATIQIKSNIQGTAIYLNNKKYGEIGEEGILKIEGIVPGSYDLLAKNESKYAKLNKKDKINFQQDSIFEENLNGINISVNSEFKDANVYINDEDTKIKVKDFKNIGPFDIDEGYKIKLKEESPWGEIFSDEKEVKNIPAINLNIDLKNESINKEIEASLKEFYISVFEALNKEDSKLIKATTKESKEQIYNELKKEYNFLKNNYDISDLQISMEKSEIKYEEGKYKGNIVVDINYSISKKILGFEFEKEKQSKSFFNGVKYEDGKWLVIEAYKFR